MVDKEVEVQRVEVFGIRLYREDEIEVVLVVKECYFRICVFYDYKFCRIVLFG